MRDTEPRRELMAHDWEPGKPHFEYWIVGDRLRSRSDGKEYTLAGFTGGFTVTGVCVTALHLSPGRWADNPRNYDNLSEEDRERKKTSREEALKKEGG